MPANAGRKPGFQHRDRNTLEPNIVVRRIEKSALNDSQQRTISSKISVSDPSKTAEKEFNFIIAQIRHKMFQNAREIPADQ